MRRFKSVLALVAFSLFGSSVWANVPQLINFQGILKDGSGNPVTDGSYLVRFRIYDDPAAGNVLWSESTSVSTTGGLFSVLLGAVIPVQASAFNDSSRYLGIKVGADPEMTPRQKLTSVGYSYNSSEWTSAGQDLFRLNGNVGIGTSIPLATLDVFQTVAGVPAGQFSSLLPGNSYGLAVQAGNSGNNFSFVARDQSGTDLFRVRGDGHVVIGSTSINLLNKLSVGGSAYFDGKVGIGLINPATKLHVSGADEGIRIQGTGSSVDNVAYMTFYNGSGSQVGYVGDGGNADNNVYLTAYDGSVGLITNAGIVLTATSIGRVGIGTTSPAELLHVNGTAGNNTGVWSNLSDRRLKKDVEPIENALETVEQLKPVSFRWKDDKKDAEFGRVRGLIAQDVEKVIPEWIKTDPDGYKRIEPIGVDALLIEAIKELKETVASQAGQIAAQSFQIEELKALVGKLAAAKKEQDKKLGQLR